MGSDQSLPVNEEEDKKKIDNSLLTTGNMGGAKRGARRSNKRGRGMKGGSSCMKMTGGRNKGKRHNNRSRRHSSR